MPHTQDEPGKPAAARTKRLQQSERARNNKELTEAQKKQRSDARRRRREQRQAEVATGPINPDYVYRTTKYGERFFGFKDARLYEAIKNGDIPRPIPLSDGGRATGWFGRTILEWQHRREEAAREQQAEA